MKTPRVGPGLTHRPQLWRRGDCTIVCCVVEGGVELREKLGRWVFSVGDLSLMQLFGDSHFLWFCWTSFSTPIKIKSKFTISPFLTQILWSFCWEWFPCFFTSKISSFNLGDHFVSTQHFPQIKSLYPPGLELRKSGQTTWFHTRKKRRALPRTNSSPPKNRPFQEENSIKFIFQAPIWRGELLVSGRVYVEGSRNHKTFTLRERIYVRCTHSHQWQLKDVLGVLFTWAENPWSLKKQTANWW